MSYQTHSSSPYNDTPKIITALILITAITTVTSAALEPLFTNVFAIPGPQEFFGLSLWGMYRNYLWQPITCLFLQNEPNGIHLFFLINLTFSLYMLWMFGSQLVESYGTGPFLRLYFLSGVIASLSALWVAHGIHPYTPLIIAGIAPSLLAIFVAWAILHRDTQILLFFIIPIKAKWLLTLVTALTLLIPLSSLDLVNFIYYFVGLSVGYLYSTVAWQQKTPFSFMENIDDFFIVLGRKVRAKYERWFSLKKKENKIVDIKTGQAIQEDDAFIDEMLAKISRYGEKSLTWQEKDRMRKISEKKLKK